MSILTQYHHLFSVKLGASLSEARKELKKKGLKEMYTVEDKSQKMHFLGGYLPSTTPPEKLVLVDHVESSPQINWEDQAKQFSPYFSDGMIQIPLSDFGNSSRVLTLLPGEGFGDLSHPTTHMMLSLLSSQVEGKNVLDIGCGNGILSLAAMYYGANQAIGIDIVEEAILLSKKNANLNQLEKQTSFFSTSNCPSLENTDVVLLNMISSEQETAWNYFSTLHTLPLLIIVSGILASNKESFIEICKKRNWNLVKEVEKDGWLGFIFIQFSTQKKP